MINNNTFRSSLRVAKIELNSMFYSPVAWLVLVLFAVQIGLTYTELFDKNIYNKMLGYQMSGISRGLFAGPYGTFTAINKYLYLYFPLLTMGLLSKEFNSGTVKLLYSSPVSNLSIVVGKFFAIATYGLALMAIIAFYIIFTVSSVTVVEWQPILTGALGIYLLMLAYSAIGLFMSSLTQYQIVAAVGTLTLFAVLNFIGGVGQTIDFVRDITYWLSISGRNYSFIEGMIASEDVFYFVIVIVTFLILTILRLKQQRDKVSSSVIAARYVVAVVVALSLGFVSSRPAMKLYSDVTYNKRNTLAPESQVVVDKLDGPLKITTYVNLFAPDYQDGMPRNYNYDIQRFERYARFKPELEMEYVYYYHEAGNREQLTERYPGKTDEEIVARICDFNGLAVDRVLSPSEIDELIDLSGERYQFVRYVERGNGETAVLRLFNDNSRHPGEAEISGALKQLVGAPMPVAFLTGHGERDITNIGEKGFYSFAYDKWFREALINHGFEAGVLDLSKQDIPQNLKILVISGLREELSTLEMEKLQKYIDQGGNLFILADYQREAVMNKLTENLGISFSSGVIVNETEFFSPTVTIGEFADFPAEVFPSMSRLKAYGYNISMPTTLAIDYSKVKDFEVIPILTSPLEKSWIEYETTDFVDGEFVLNPDADEVEASHATLIALRRKVGDTEQRIMIAGDSDFIANGELGENRRGIYTANFGVIRGAFRWFSNDQYPIYTHRASLIDRELCFDRGARKPLKMLFKYIIPALLVLAGAIIIMRRQRK